MKYGIVELNEPNVRNDHMYLKAIYDPFPETVKGGRSEDFLAPSSVVVHYGADQPAVTDIDGSKKIFRKRAWQGEFFNLHQLKAGDRVVIEHIRGLEYHVYPVRVG